MEELEAENDQFKAQLDKHTEEHKQLKLNNLDKENKVSQLKEEVERAQVVVSEKVKIIKKMETNGVKMQK